MQREFHREDEPPGTDLPIVIVATARLPATCDARVLMIELAVERDDGAIVRVASNMPMPGYNRPLRRLLLGLRLDQVARVASQVGAHLRGPLLKPTLAALTNGLANELAPSRPASATDTGDRGEPR